MHLSSSMIVKNFKSHLTGLLVGSTDVWTTNKIGVFGEKAQMFPARIRETYGEEQARGK